LLDDHEFAAQGAGQLLELQCRLEICGEARTGREGRQMAEELKPDIIILDISMPDLNGVEAAKRIRKASAAVEILIYPCIIPSNSYVKLWMRGTGLHREINSDRDLVIAIEALGRHKPFFTPTQRK